MWPKFIGGKHLDKLAEIYDRIIDGDLKRACISVAPRHSKSENSSWLFPSYAYGRKPDLKVIQICNLAERAADWGRKVRDTLDSDVFHEIFPGVSVKDDSRAAHRWNTSQGGDYFGTGTGGALAGRGADLCILDDPIDEQTAMQAQYNPKIFDGIFDWYNTGPRQRLQPNAAILIIMTRWGKRDLIGRVLEQASQNNSTDEWEVFEFPALMPSGKPLWPEFWSQKELEEVKRDLPTSRWLSQYQQTPTAGEGSIVKREWWKEWKGSSLPDCQYIIQSWDTAFSQKTSADYSACTTWGVFYHENPSGRKVPNVILLHAYRDRVEFPALKKRFLQLQADWKPDTTIVEARSSGQPLIFEMRAMGVPVEDYTPSRGNDKLVRVNAVADLFSSGMIWYRTDKMADYVIEEFADFPAGTNDDLLDSSTQALLRLREGMFIGAASDEYKIYEDDDEEVVHYRRKWGYY